MLASDILLYWIESNLEAGTHAWQVPIFPNDSNSGVEETFKVGHRPNCIKEKTNKVGEGKMRNAVFCPRTVVVHFWDASFT